MASTDVEPVEVETKTEVAEKLAAPVVVKRTTGEVDIKKLLEAGAHFGHKTSRWHPKMAPYIHSKRAGNHIIDLTKTVPALEEALRFITEITSNGKQVLMVGTKRQAKDI